MNHAWGASARAIEAGFVTLGLTVRPVGYGRWALAAGFTGAAGLSVRLADGWILLDMPCGNAERAVTGAELLKCNGLLAGTTKFAIAPSDGTVRIRAEIPLEEEADLRSSLADVLEGFRQAHQVLCGESISPPASRAIESGPAATGSDVAGWRLSDLATEGGWPFVERSPEKLAVELEGCRGFHQAILEEQPAGAIRATVGLVSWESASPESQAALALLLLSAGGLARMARPVLEESGVSVAGRFEVCSSVLRTPAWLGRALSALSVACRLCGREAAVLVDAGIARDYLALRGIGVHQLVPEAAPSGP